MNKTEKNIVKYIIAILEDEGFITTTIEEWLCGMLDNEEERK